MEAFLNESSMGPFEVGGPISLAPENIMCNLSIVVSFAFVYGMNFLRKSQTLDFSSSNSEKRLL